MIKLTFSFLFFATVALSGCSDNKPAPVPAPANNPGGVQVQAPNVDIKSDKNKVEIRTPGADVNVDKK